MKAIGLLRCDGGVEEMTLAVHRAALAQQAGQRTLLMDTTVTGGREPALLPSRRSRMMAR
jgi:hypothetical protein